MSDGPVGNGARIAGSVVDALKMQPLLLVLLLFNAGFFVLFHFTAKDSRERQATMVEAMLENQSKLQEMLARCTMTPRTDLPQVPPS
jgi:hypothetical protein